MNPFQNTEQEVKIPRGMKEVFPQYLSPELGLSYRLWRFDKLADRYYNEYNANGVLVGRYISITSLAKKMVPDEGQVLARWQARKGWELAQNEKNEKADYGTFYHQECLDWLEKRTAYSTDGLIDRLYERVPARWHQYIENGEGSALGSSWEAQIRKDLVCWFQFVKDRVKKVWAVEAQIRNQEYGYCLTGDLICEIEWRGATRMAGVDLKSGKKGFYAAHEFQLEGLRHAWNQTFPDHQITHLFNFAPKDWKKPTKEMYKLQDQTNNRYSHKCRDGLTSFQHLMEAQMGAGFNIPKQTFTDININFVDVADFDPEQAIEKYEI